MNWIQKVAVKLFRISIPEPISYYQQKIIAFALAKAEYSKVVFVGDSITDAWSTTGLLPNTVLNYGIAGDVTSGVLDRVEQIVNAKPLKVLINIGINDLSFKKTSTIDNYKKIVGRLVQVLPPQNIICCAVRPVNYLLPMAKSIYSNNIPIRALNQSILDVCISTGCTFEPQTYTVHVTPFVPDEIMIVDHTTDGIHLSPLGYQMEYEIIKKYL